MVTTRAWTQWLKFYKLALIYEFMNGHNHLSQSFIILFMHFLRKLPEIIELSMVRPSRGPPTYEGKILKVSKGTGCASSNVRSSNISVISMLPLILILCAILMKCAECAPCQNLDFREVGG